MGRRTGMIDPSGSTAFGYDLRGRLVSKTINLNGVVDPYVVSRAYTPGGRTSNFTFPDGRTIDYDRTSCMCSIDKVTTTLNSVTKTLVDNLDYRPFGSAQAMGTGNGGTVNNIHDQNGRLVVANPGAPKEESYTYDANGNLTSKAGAATPWFNRTFTYDALNRLVNASGSFGTINYGYDKVGNRSYVNENGQVSYYAYVPNSNKLNSISGANSVNYTYDANGNITGINNKVLTYNQNNRLISVEEDGSVLGEYTYNGLGQRVSKAVGADTIYFIYDFEGKLISEAALDGTVTVNYLYMGENRMARVHTGTGNFYYYLNDSLGTPQMLTDENNTVVWEGLYKPFGEADVNPNSTVENNFRFPGQYYDEETGLHYNYHRYYDPTTGRYLRPDPIGLDGLDPNIYGYAKSNPINAFDTFGLYKEYLYSNDPYPFTGRNGMLAHQRFFGYIKSKYALSNLRNIRTDTSLDGSFTGRPDVIDTISRQVWELKPITHYKNLQYIAFDELQIGGYCESSGYTKGDPLALMGSEKTYIGEIEDAFGTRPIWVYAFSDRPGMLYWAPGKYKRKPVRQVVKEIASEVARTLPKAAIFSLPWLKPIPTKGPAPVPVPVPVH